MNPKPTSSPFGTNVPQNPPIRPLDDSGEWFDKDKKAITLVQWGLMSIGHYKAAALTEKILPVGAYDVSKDEQDGKIVFIKKNLIHDKLLSLQGLPKQIISEINGFWGKEDKFTQMGFLHRRGYLFYGAHGTGKSSLVHEIVDGVLANGGIVFYCGHPKLFNEGLSLFRQLEPRRKVVCIFEDIDAIIKQYGEAEILSILDGENQISGVCNLATTNYPELLDKRIVGRPRRFDRVYRIGNLDDKARKAYLEKKLPVNQDVESWLKKTKGLSIAQISEVIISTLCLDLKLDEAITIVQELTKDKSSEQYREAGVGFNQDKDDDN